MPNAQNCLGPERDGQRISFAQNGEDVRLWRAFRGVEHGFYVEVGGWDPIEHSATWSFYLRGWSGLVVEPVAENAEAIRARRPRDLVVPLAAGSDEGLVDLTVFPSTGLSTVVGEHAARHRADGREGSVRRVTQRPLRSILAEHPVSEIHFLLVDVEGAEADVIAGMDFEEYRPWVVVVEATEPGSPVPSPVTWEPELLSAGYDFVTFDGLNRFYVAQEHADLGALVALPPNVFDSYRPAAWALTEMQRTDSERKRVLAAEREDALGALLASSQAQRDGLHARIRSLEAKLEETARERDTAQGERDSARAQLSALMSSRSWAITRPLRRARGSR